MEAYAQSMLSVIIEFMNSFARGERGYKNEVRSCNYVIGAYVLEEIFTL